MVVKLFQLRSSVSLSDLHFEMKLTQDVGDSSASTILGGQGEWTQARIVCFSIHGSREGLGLTASRLAERNGYISRPGFLPRILSSRCWSISSAEHPKSVTFVDALFSTPTTSPSPHSLHPRRIHTHFVNQPQELAHVPYIGRLRPIHTHSFQHKTISKDHSFRAIKLSTCSLSKLFPSWP
jgi:hypothetical protein